MPRSSTYLPTASRTSTPCTAARSTRTPWRLDLLRAGDDLRRQPLIERKKELKWVLRNAREGVQYVEHTEGDGAEMFAAVCKLGLEGIVSSGHFGLQVRLVEDVDQGQKSEVGGCDARA